MSLKNWATQCTSSAEPSQQKDKGVENGGESRDGKLDLWKPLDRLAEVANRSKSFKSNSEGRDSKLELEPIHVINPEAQTCRNKHRKDNRKIKVEEEKNSAAPATTSGIANPKKSRRIRQKSGSGFGDSGISLQAVLDAACPKHEKRIGPVWFSLVASEDQ